MTTSRSDTLWELALRNRPQGASVHQTMLAIQDLNPGAFSNGNINQLKAGKT
ncbi:FimV/HubP family polar landmark protein [Halopseudomonas pachastrellae]|nr:FimV/HubP family polar landmark protein [Halopseudomonas pachastrellae]